MLKSADGLLHAVSPAWTEIHLPLCSLQQPHDGHHLTAGPLVAQQWQFESSCWPCLQVQVLKQRPDLKLVVMSATLEAEKFQGYFLDAPLMKVCGPSRLLDHACHVYDNAHGWNQ